MSKLFYDHLLEFESLDSYIDEICEIEEERTELWSIVDEIIHHRVLGCILDHLPEDHHDHFVERYKNEPYNEELIVFINEKIEHDIEEKLREDLVKLEEELLNELTK